TTPLHFLPISRTPPPPPLFPYTPLFRSDRAERAPTAEELFSDGPHIATASHEVGNAGLDTERAFNAELGLHLHHGRLEAKAAIRSEEHTSELQSRENLVCRLLLEKKNNR